MAGKRRQRELRTGGLQGKGNVSRCEDLMKEAETGNEPGELLLASSPECGPENLVWCPAAWVTQGPLEWETNKTQREVGEPEAFLPTVGRDSMLLPVPRTQNLGKKMVREMPPGERRCWKGTFNLGMCFLPPSVPHCQLFSGKWEVSYRKSFLSLPLSFVSLSLPSPFSPSLSPSLFLLLPLSPPPFPSLFSLSPSNSNLHV